MVLEHSEAEGERVLPRRVRRLVDRHTRHGRSVEAATAWARDVDGANSVLIEASRPRATLVVDGTAGLTA